MRYEKRAVTSVHQCAGSPLQPREPTQRVCNVRWAGARLTDILAECEPRSPARFVWSTGADYGDFGGVSVDAYVKDIPIERVKSDVLVAYEMNGKPLTPEHGFPARLVVPGFLRYEQCEVAHACDVGRRASVGAFHNALVQ
jgi:DMSO/TMAO reductase YedYZ molybdopterin-dependent catalytic subunit